MQALKVIQLSHYRKPQKKKRSRTKKLGQQGYVYARGGKLWVSFSYLGERVRESSGLYNTKENNKKVRKQLDLIVAEIKNDIFEFSKRFPNSKKVQHFAELEGRRVTVLPDTVLFSEYLKQWWKDMEPGMTQGKKTDYLSLLNNHILPYFGERPFSDFTNVLMKKFLAHLSSKINRRGNKLSPAYIRNVMIPLRNISRDAFDEYGWTSIRDPFSRLTLPKNVKFRVRPFNFKEWDILMEHTPEWYRPYFNFAVQTGLRPSEQVALKWIAIDDEYIHIELSRVRNREKRELKTAESIRRIRLRPNLEKLLAQQKEMTRDIKSPYVFLNMHGNVVDQVNLREVWTLAMKKSGLAERRMYETRHTFASWALHLGEMPEWVAHTLGHVDTSMVYRTYGRYIPNLTRDDGSAFEKRFS